MAVRDPWETGIHAFGVSVTLVERDGRCLPRLKNGYIDRGIGNIGEREHGRGPSLSFGTAIGELGTLADANTTATRTGEQERVVGETRTNETGDSGTEHRGNANADSE